MDSVSLSHALSGTRDDGLTAASFIITHALASSLEGLQASAVEEYEEWDFFPAHPGIILELPQGKIPMHQVNL